MWRKVLSVARGTMAACVWAAFLIGAFEKRILKSVEKDICSRWRKPGWVGDGERDEVSLS